MRNFAYRRRTFQGEWGVVRNARLELHHSFEEI